MMALRFVGTKRVVKRCILFLFLTLFLVNLWIGMRFEVFYNRAGPGRNSGSGKGIISRNGLTANHDTNAKSAKNATLDKPLDSCPYWCYGNSHKQDGLTIGENGKPYFLTAVISVRIYDWKDLAKLSTRELIQWLRYVSYAGVDHVYLYDSYAFKNESQKESLREYIASGFLTYTDWHHRAVPFSLGGTQASAYADCIQRWGNLSSWQLGIDMDEYPFFPVDREPGFLARYLRDFDTSAPDAAKISELSMQNYLYLGKPLDVSKHPLLIDRIWRRTKTPANHLVKPVYRPAAITWPDIHRNSLKYGSRQTLPETDLRMNHYWGARLQNWGDDTQEILDRTVEDRSMEPIVANLYKCDSCKAS